MDYSRYNPTVQKWIQVMIENAEINGELTLKYCKDLIEYGLEQGDDVLVALGYYYRGIVFYISNEGDLFYEAVTSALSYLSKVEEWELMARCYNFLGISAVNHGNAVVGLDYYLYAMQYSEKADVKSFQSMVLINIGALYVTYKRYDDAVECLQNAMDYFCQHPEHPRYDSCMISIYQNMAKAYLSKGMMVEAKCCFENIYSEHRDRMDEKEQLAVWATEAIYYHIADDDERCEKCIRSIHEQTKGQLSLMDMFDDVYDYCRILLERGKEDEFWEILRFLEPGVQSVGITNMVLRVRSLKTRFYQKKNMQAEYLESAGKYYEISERLDMENRIMMNSVLNIRKNLEKMHREKEEMEKSNELLREKSETDALTGLSNRFRLDDFADELFTRAIKSGTPLAIELLDIDCFKQYNDYYGHQKGDECIRKIATAIKSMEEFGAFTARYGGDEFVVIYEGISKDEAITYMAELRARVLALGIEHSKSKAALNVTISQGLCYDIPVQGITMKDYIHTADEMLYRVKQKKRNNFCAGNLLMTGDQIVMSYL